VIFLQPWVSFVEFAEVASEESFPCYQAFVSNKLLPRRRVYKTTPWFTATAEKEKPTPAQAPSHRPSDRRYPAGKPPLPPRRINNLGANTIPWSLHSFPHLSATIPGFVLHPLIPLRNPLFYVVLGVGSVRVRRGFWVCVFRLCMLLSYLNKGTI
jgi:hypothetical protein